MHKDKKQKIQYIESLVRSNNVVFNQPPATRKLKNIHGNLPTGFPLGNGKFGGILNLYKNSFDIQLNHTNFWRYDPNTKFHPQYGSRPFGLAQLECSWSGIFGEEPIEYKSELNLFNAKTETTIESESAKFSVESFFANDEDLAIFTIIPNSPSPFNIELSLTKWRKNSKLLIEDDMLFVTDSPELARSKSENTYLNKLTNGKHENLFSSQTIGLRVLGGVKTFVYEDLENPKLRIENRGNESIVILVGTEVNESTVINDYTKEAVKSKLQNIDNSTIDTFYNKHLENWKEFWQASYIQLESDDSLAVMYEHIWYMQLYLMASSNQGNYPAKMNGSIWTVDQDERPWGGGYWHFNQNTMHGALLAANHPEYTRRYTDRVSDNIDVLKVQTKHLWGNEGVFVHETHSPDMTMYEFDRLPIYENNPKWTSHVFSTTLEIAYQMYHYANYTGDENYMKEVVFPFLKEACLFYTQQLKKDKNGIYYMFPSNAHENHWSVKNPHNDLAAIYRCFPILIEMYEKYGGNINEKQKYQKVLANMSSFPKGKAIRDYKQNLKAPITVIDTTVNVFAPCEFIDDWKTHNVHSVDNYSSYPFELTTKGHPLYGTAVNTIKNSFFPEIWGGLMRRMIPSAVLHMPEQTREYCRQYLETIQMPANGVGPTEPMGDMALALNYMLLHSFDSLIQIGPSLPKNWNTEFKLLAQGPVEVTAQISNGEVSYLSMLPTKDQTIRLSNPWGQEVEIATEKNDTICLSGEILKWKAIKGTTYLIVPKVKSQKYKPLRNRKKTKLIKEFGNKKIGIQ